jgi:hypothetical protein
MNKKLIGALFSILTLAILIAPVMAGKEQTRQSFQLVYQEHPLSTDGPDSHAGPVGSVLGVDLRTFHGRDCTHDSDILLSTLTIGGIAEEYTIHKQGGCNYDFNSKTMMVIHRVTETLTLSFEGTTYGTIVLSIIEKIDWSTMESEGTFIGSGTDMFEDVKIVGTISSEIVDWDAFDPNYMVLEITYIGTVMGWPT